ncbi:MAG: glycosyltransferase [Bryobacterales bacterium]|nr:glycosyltransferase [Bryobacterales bacterium]
MSRLRQIVAGFPLALLAPLFALAAWLGLTLTDLLWRALGKRIAPRDTRPGNRSASVVIPNWNGRDLLEKYLPSVLTALSGNAANEVIVVDNGSADGSVEFLREHFPTVRVIALNENLGFGGGSNRGFAEARNDIVVLLNSDMRVAPGFLAPLLEGFTGEAVFAVACQIFFSDAAKVREETGLTQAWWSQGALRVRHRVDDKVTALYPCFYGGGGSCAFDRRKFLELGGFHELYKPFYLEDTDLGLLAWKRGWKVFYEPRSHVWHEHRGTIGKKFTPGFIEGVLQKNFLLFTWKNIHEPGRLAASFAYAVPGAWLSWLAGDSRERTSPAGLARAFLRLVPACRARWHSRSLAVISDTEAFRRPLGGYFRDRFCADGPASSRLQVLFLSPYPVAPPIHGGAVFMNQTLREMGKYTGVHLVALLDSPHEEPAHAELAAACASQEFLIRLEGQPKGVGALSPFAVREFCNADLDWLIHRQLYTHAIDILQIEYTHMGQYAGQYRRIVNALFEHDVYFQSVGRRIGAIDGVFAKAKAGFEYLRALRYELRTLPRMDLVETCTAENNEYLLSFLPELRDRISEDYRAGIDTSRYEYREAGREPSTVLFLGSFRHAPNVEALNWFLQGVMPRLVELHPEVRLLIAGSDPPPAYTLPYKGPEVELLGFVPEVRDALARYAVFVCPILSGSGVRVKLLEAFAAGIPSVSTTVGAEGLTTSDGSICRLADDPAPFARAVVELLQDPREAAAMAARAREYVVRHRDIRTMTTRLCDEYRRVLEKKRGYGLAGRKAS